MKIAIICERFDPTGGGAERSTLQIAQELASRGHAVTVLAGSAPLNTDVSSVTVRARSHRASSSALRLLSFARWVKNELAANHDAFDATMSVTTAVAADIVQPRSGTMRATLEQNIALRKSPIKRLAKRISIALSPKHQLLLHLERKSMKSPEVKTFVALSEYVVHQLVEHYAVDSSHIEIIPNAAVMPEMTTAERRKARVALRRSLNIDDEQPVFIFLAHNPRLKGFDTVLRAMAILEQEKLSAVCLCAGSLNHSMNRAASALGVRDSMRWIGPTNDAATIFAASDVLVHPTWYDPSSKVVIESLMMGVPAITTRFNGASDLMTNGHDTVAGRLLDDPGDAEALADAMRELCDPKARRACKLDRAALADQLSMKRHVDALEAVLKRVAADRIASVEDG